MLLFIFLTMLTLVSSAPAADGVTAFPTPSGKILCTDAQGPILSLAPAVWGPKWAWTGTKADFADGKIHVHGKMGGTDVPFRLDLAVTADATGLDLAWSLGAEADTDTTLVVLALDLDQRWRDAGAIVVSGESRSERAIPFGREPLGEAVTAIEVGGGPALRLSTPIEVQADGAARIVLAKQLLTAGEVRSGSLRLDLGRPLIWYADPDAIPFPSDWERWFPWQPQGKDDQAGAIGLQAWLDAPAGKHGRVRREGDHLMVGDRPMKFWGLNVCYDSCAPEKDLADKRAAFYAKMGVNCVRLHKYADGAGWAGIQSADSCAVLDPEGLDRMDYFVAKLKEKGIYVKLSPVFMVKLGAGDREAVPWMDEFGPLKKDRNARVDTKHGAIYLAEELQDRLITQMRNLLTHRNPYTGLTYAEDPAIMTVELFNEDSALFFGSMGQLQRVPTLRARAGAAFTAWLKERYADEAALRAAWGDAALNSFAAERLIGESWADGTILPAGNPWFYDPDQLAGSQAPKKARLLDTMHFLADLQDRFYARFAAAIKDVGYEGEIISSNWIAGRAFSHYWNLHSDARFGIVDRHNYQGAESMLGRAGSGMLSIGMQQVADRPFSLSEWIHVFPHELGAEGPVLLGAYGMGLQDWDISFIFQNRDAGTWSDRIGRDRWDAVAPQILATFPTIARQLARGDVGPARQTVALEVSPAGLAKGELGVVDRTEQQGDIKAFDTAAVSSRTLALHRVCVAFTDTPKPTPAVDVDAALREGDLVSDTGQLRWREGDRARVVIDTPATQAVLGTVGGETIPCGQVTFAPVTGWCYLAVTAVDREADLLSGKRLLVTALARARNTGMKFAGGELIAAGKAPILMEPVVADLTIARAGATVHVLDHDGLRTGATLPVVDGKVRIDGGETKAVWYEIAFE